MKTWKEVQWEVRKNEFTWKEGWNEVREQEKEGQKEVSAKKLS